MSVSFSWSLSVAPSSAPASEPTSAEAAALTALRDLAWDATGNDLAFVDGDLVEVVGAEAIASDVLAALQTFAREWFLDTTIGVDYRGDVFVKGGPRKAEQVIKAKVLEVPGVTGFESFSTNFVGRELAVTFRATASLGAVIDLEFSANVSQSEV